MEKAVYLVVILFGLLGCAENPKSENEKSNCLNLPGISPNSRSTPLSIHNTVMSLFDEERLDTKNSGTNDTLIRVYVGRRFHNGIIITVKKYFNCEKYIVRLKEVPDIDSKIIDLTYSLLPSSIDYQTSKKVIRSGRPLNIGELLKPNKAYDNEPFMDGPTCAMEWKIGNDYNLVVFNMLSNDSVSLQIKNFITQFYIEKSDALNTLCN